MCRKQWRGSYNSLTNLDDQFFEWMLTLYGKLFHVFSNEANMECYKMQNFTELNEVSNLLNNQQRNNRWFESFEAWKDKISGYYSPHCVLLKDLKIVIFLIEGLLLFILLKSSQSGWQIWGCYERNPFRLSCSASQRCCSLKIRGASYCQRGVPWRWSFVKIKF